MVANQSRSVDTSVARPTGTVALLLAGFERSPVGDTRQTDGREMEEGVATRDGVIAAAIARYDGVCAAGPGDGDSFVAAFVRASDALGCALALQLATSAGATGLRIGVHIGEVRLGEDGSYEGAAIDLAVRLRDAANPGQILMSNTVADMAGDALPDDASLLDLGAHALRDMARPEHLWQLCHPMLAEHHPALRSFDAPRTNLPVRLTTMVGRLDEIERVGDELDRARTLTLTGAGGCGKTRLALEVAAERLDRHAGGVWFVDLAAIRDPDEVGPAVAEAIGLVHLGSSVSDSLARAIDEDSVLVLLDNCEHLVGECAALATTLLRRCPSLVVMATSREPLGVEGEVTFRVPSLSVPGEDRPPDLETVAAFEAVELFVERARRARPQFALDESNVAAVVEICRRLDGMPLAIELAAARLRVLSPGQVLDGLQDRFRLLSGGSRMAMARQQTLEASVDWSYALLLDDERTVLNRLSVFAGGFTIAAAEMVCAGDPLEGHHVAELVMQLVDKSLVIAQEASDRFTLLETVRAFAAAKLVDSGDADAIRARHHRACLEMARSEAHNDVLYRRRVAADYDNIRRALQWAEDQADPALLGHLAARMFLYWSAGRRMHEGSRWFERVVDREPDPARRASALSSYGLLLSLAGDADRALPAARESLVLIRQMDDPAALLWGLLTMGIGYVPSEEKLVLLEEAVALAKEVGDVQAHAWGLSQIGWVLAPDDPLGAIEALRESVALAEDGGHEWIRILSVAHMAVLKTRMVDLRTAEHALDTAVATLVTASEGSMAGTAMAFLAGVREMSGDRGGADIVLGWLDAFAADVGSARALMCRGAARGWVATLRGDFDGAVMLLRPTTEQPLSALELAQCLASLAVAEGLAGIATAAIHAEEAMALHRRAARDSPCGTATYAAALAARSAGDLEKAEDLARGAIAETHVWPMAPWVRIGPVQVLASLLARSDRVEEAVRLFGAAIAHAERVGIAPGNAVMRAEADGQVEAARQLLGDERFGELWREGSALTWEEAVAYAQRGRGERKRPKTGWTSLTPTEHQVVGLVTQGSSNAEIGERLFIAVPTVKTHLTHIYWKLGLSTRGQLTAAAASRTANATDV